MGSGVSAQDSVKRARLPDPLGRVRALARGKLAARFGRVEWVLLATLVALPVALAWRFASTSFYFEDDIALFYVAQNSDSGLWSYALAPSWGHLAPGYSLTYLTLDRIAPMNFDVALAMLVGCQAVSAALLQRILALLFGRAWWTYALALAWAISVVYLPSFAWFAAGLHSIPAITATLASVHGYLCWRATGRRGWLAWSLVAMCIGVAFYEKALLVPLYLILMRVLLLDPAARLRDSLRSVRDEWRVWLAYAAVWAAFLLVYSLGSYLRPEGGATVGDVLLYLRVFWVEGFSPMIFGVRVPQGAHDDWQRIAIVAAQVALIGLIAWSVARSRAAWRAWAFLLIAVAANALMVLGRVSQLGPEWVGYNVRYYTESALLVTLAIAFAFAVPRLRARVATVEPAVLAAAPGGRSRPRPAANLKSFQLPGQRAGIVALVALAAYVGTTWATADTFSNRAGGGWDPLHPEKQSGRFARVYLDNLRSDLAAARRAGVRVSLLDHDVPEPVMSGFTNIDRQSGVRNTLLSSVVPLFEEQVSFNQPGSLNIVGHDGRLQPTRFVPVAGGSLAEVRRAGRLRIHEARSVHRRGDWCVLADRGRGALEWKLRRQLRGRDWWLRVEYGADSALPLEVQANPGLGWVDEGSELPSRDSSGTAIVDLAELPTGPPTNAGVRFMIPPSGRLCPRSLEIGSFDPPATAPRVGRRQRVRVVDAP